MDPITPTTLPTPQASPSPVSLPSSQPVRMTSAQYQAKYGTPPPKAAAPVKMTRAAYIQKYNVNPDGSPLTTPQSIGADYAKNKNVPEVVARSIGEAANETNDALNSSWSPIGWVTKAIGGAANVLGSGVEHIDNYIAPKIGTALRTLVGADNADAVGAKIKAAAASPVATSIQKTYGAGSDVDKAATAVTGALNLAGTEGGIEGVVDGAGTLGKAVKPLADNLAENAAGQNAPKAAADATKTVAKITQAEPGEIPAAQRGLTGIDPTSVKTFADLSGKLDTNIKQELANVDKNVGAVTEKFTPADIQKEIPVAGGQSPIVSDPVGEGLKQLETFYEKTNDPQNLARIKGLQDTYTNDGLTPKQINDIAREHGSELNGYNANGELASGLTKQAAENTRAGIKGVVDNLAPDAGRQASDAHISDLIRTKELVDEMDRKAQLLQNRMKEYSPLQKAGRFAGKAVDMFSGGVVKGFLRSILGIGGENGTTLNALDLQKQLGSNLKLLERLNSMNPEAAIQEIGKAIQKQEQLALPAGSTAPTTPNTSPVLPTASVQTPITLPPPASAISEPQAPAGNYQNTSPAPYSALPDAMSPDQRVALQGEVVKDATRFRSLKGYQNYVKGNPSILNKISIAGLTPESVWENALAEFKKMGAQNPLGKGKGSIPIPSKFGAGGPKDFTGGINLPPLK